MVASVALIQKFARTPPQCSGEFLNRHTRECTVGEPEREPLMILTTVIFALTYLGMALGRVPGLRIDRAGIALPDALDHGLVEAHVVRGRVHLVVGKEDNVGPLLDDACGLLVKVELVPLVGRNVRGVASRLGRDRPALVGASASRGSRRRDGGAPRGVRREAAGRPAVRRVSRRRDPQPGLRLGKTRRGRGPRRSDGAREPGSRRRRPARSAHRGAAPVTR